MKDLRTLSEIANGNVTTTEIKMSSILTTSINVEMYSNYVKRL